MEEKKLVPKLRFPGFTEPWEQRKLGEILVERNQQFPMDCEYPLMAFIANEGVAPKGERYDRSALVTDSENKLYKRTELGDFIYSSNNLETGSIGLNKFGNACISPVYSIFKSTEIGDPKFLGRRLVRKDIINAMIRWRQGVIYGQWRIHESDFLKIIISIPLIEEQRKIGMFLTKVDTLITLHQRKLEHLKLKKKSLLQKLFPKEGEVYPELRFPGFTDPWEQRKLGELADGVFGGGTPKTSIDTYWNGSIPWIQSSNLMDDKIENFINDKSITNLAIKESATKLIPANSIAIVTRVGVGKVALIREKFATSQDFLSIYCGHEHNPLFMAYQISRLMKVKSRLLQGTSIKGITKSEVLESEVLIPKGIEEENKIADFLSSCDNLITLHQRKLEHLQLLKKALLQQLFV